MPFQSVQNQVFAILAILQIQFENVNHFISCKNWLALKYSEEDVNNHTANVYRDLRVVYREIRVRGFQIYGDCMLPTIPVVLKPPYSHFHCNICGKFDFKGILWGYTILVVGKSFINYGETM